MEVNAPELPAILRTAVPVTYKTDLRTSGWDLLLGWHDLLSNVLTYCPKFNLSEPRTKSTPYPNHPPQSHTTTTN